MNIKLLSMICVSILSIAISNGRAEERTVVEGVVEENTTLIPYLEKGKRYKEKVNDGEEKEITFTDVTTEEIKGTVVLAANSRLVKVKFRGKEVWLRKGRLKLSLHDLPPCPEASAGKSTDSNTPVSSGLGNNKYCIEK